MRDVAIVKNQLFRFMSLLKPYRGSILKIALSAMLLSVLGMIGPWVTKILIDNVLPNKDYNLLLFVLLVSLSLGVFQPLMGVLRQLFSLTVGMEMSLDVRLRFLGHLQVLPVSFYDSRQTGEVLSRVGDADQSLGNVLTMVNSGLTNLASLLIFPPILLLINWRLALLGLVILPFDLLLYTYANKRIKKYTRLVAEKRAELSATNYELVSGIRLTKSLCLERAAISKVEQLICEAQDLQTKLALVQQGTGYLITVLRGVGTFAYTYYGWHQILGGSMSLGTFMAFSNYVMYMYNPVRELVDMTQNIQQTLVHTNRFFEIYDLEPETKNTEKALKLPPTRGDIRFQGVSFGYNGSPEVLRSLDLTVRAGSTVALVGRSGIGKTTIANLLLRFYSPKEGTITIDGHDIQFVNLESLRRQIGYVLQDPFLVAGSIRENIALSSSVASDLDVERACKSASAHEFIMALPQGYDTVVGERGVKLSQGQRQRLCLARTLLLDPPILILDEATSSLDLKTEANIQSILSELRQTKTTIIIAHRLSTLLDADVIYVLNDGRAVESGSHEELMHTGRIYRDLYERELSVEGRS